VREIAKCEVSSIIRTPEHSSACGGMRTAAGEDQHRAHSHKFGGATMSSEETDGKTAQMHSKCSVVQGNSDQLPHQSQDPGTYYSNIVSHLTVLAGAEKPLAETERKRCCHTFAHLWPVPRRSAMCLPALAPGRTQPR
jgi:hypothetical protein